MHRPSPAARSGGSRSSILQRPERDVRPGCTKASSCSSSNGSFGFEMETFEFLNMCPRHGFPRMMGVLTARLVPQPDRAASRTKKQMNGASGPTSTRGASSSTSRASSSLPPLPEGATSRTSRASRSVMKFRPLSRNSVVCSRASRTSTPPAAIIARPVLSRSVCESSATCANTFFKPGMRVHLSDGRSFADLAPCPPSTTRRAARRHAPRGGSPAREMLSTVRADPSNLGASRTTPDAVKCTAPTPRRPLHRRRRPPPPPEARTPPRRGRRRGSGRRGDDGRRRGRRRGGGDARPRASHGRRRLQLAGVDERVGAQELRLFAGGVLLGADGVEEDEATTTTPSEDDDDDDDDDDGGVGEVAVECDDAAAAAHPRRACADRRSLTTSAARPRRLRRRRDDCGDANEYARSCRRLAALEDDSGSHAGRGGRGALARARPTAQQDGRPAAARAAACVRRRVAAGVGDASSLPAAILHAGRCRRDDGDGAATRRRRRSSGSAVALRRSWPRRSLPASTSRLAQKVERRPRRRARAGCARGADRLFVPRAGASAVCPPALARRRRAARRPSRTSRRRPVYVGARRAAARARRRPTTVDGAYAPVPAPAAYARGGVARPPSSQRGEEVVDSLTRSARGLPPPETSGRRARQTGGSTARRAAGDVRRRLRTTVLACSRRWTTGPCQNSAP